MKKLNLASGQRPFKNWVNVDIRDQGYPLDVVCDATKLSEIEDDSVDIIVAHHLVEHIRLNDILGATKEWHRVLKPGGKLAIFVPNLRELAKGWLTGKIETFIFLVNAYGAYQGYVEDTHKWGFDKDELILRVSGAGEIDWGVRDITRDVLVNDPLYKDSDCALDWWILAVEFTKK